jgi:hypothetical protein
MTREDLGDGLYYGFSLGIHECCGCKVISNDTTTIIIVIQIVSKNGNEGCEGKA